jgi:hypothetical protein
LYFYNFFSTTTCRRRLPAVAPAAHLEAVFTLAKCNINTQVDKLFYKGKVRLECPAQLHVFKVHAGVLRLQCGDFYLYGFDPASFGLYHCSVVFAGLWRKLVRQSGAVKGIACSVFTGRL